LRLLLQALLAAGVSPRFIAQQGLDAVYSGSIYALFAVGYTLVFGVLDILNLAHSAVFTVGAVVAWILVVNLALPFWLAAIVAIAVCGVIGYVLDRTAFRPLRRRGAPHIASLISSIGVALILVSLSERAIGAAAHAFPERSVPSGVLHPAGLTVDLFKLGILGVTILLMAVLGYVVRRTAAGRAMRAVAENPRASLLVGINVDRVIALTLVLSSALGGLAGILYAVSQADVSPYIGRDQVELRGLAVIVVGGMGSVTGAVVAGYVLAIAETATLVLVGSNARAGVAFAILFLTLVLLPSGIFGQRRQRST